MLTAMSMWVAASIAGANSQMSRVVLMGMLAMMLAVGLLLQRIYGWKLILRKLMVKNLLARRLLLKEYISFGQKDLV